ncbi:hypothetical protein [Streptomyces inhibens]|nr:hypothetical protein [Streptomyces inhibens]
MIPMNVRHASPAAAGQNMLHHTSRAVALTFAVVLFALLLANLAYNFMSPGGGLDTPQLTILGALFLACVIISTDALTELSFGPLKARWKIDELERKVCALQLAVGAIVTSYEREHLKKLIGKGSDYVTFQWSLYHELERLLALGYITPADRERGLRSIRDISGEQDGYAFHLRDHVEITPVGEDYLDLYKEWFEADTQQQA